MIALDLTGSLPETPVWAPPFAVAPAPPVSDPPPALTTDVELAQLVGGRNRRAAVAILAGAAVAALAVVGYAIAATAESPPMPPAAAVADPPPAPTDLAPAVTAPRSPELLPDSGR